MFATMEPKSFPYTDIAIEQTIKTDELINRVVVTKPSFANSNGDINPISLFIDFTNILQFATN